MCFGYFITIPKYFEIDKYLIPLYFYIYYMILIKL